MKTFYLDSQIGSRDYDGWFGKIIGPKSVQDFLSDVGEGERCTIEINSPGGDVVSGIAIANSIKNSKAHVVGHIVGIAASMASVIACACDEVRIEEGAFLMIHNPWSCSVGDSEALRKDAALLDQMKASMITFYRGKFPGKTADELAAIMDYETWMTGTEAKAAGFSCEVISSGARMAACATEMHFAKIPEAAAKFLNVKIRAAAPADEPAAAPTPAPETTAGETTPSPETPADEPQTEPTPAPETTAGEQSDMVTRAECERRVRGMQSAMGRQIQALQAEMTETIKSFKDQLAKRDEELATANAKVTSLEARCADAENELRATASALEAKSHALAQLNANVNQPSAHPRDAVPARDVLARLPMSQRAAYYKAHQAEIDNQ